MKFQQLLPANELEAFEQATNDYSSRCVRLHADRSRCELPFETSVVPWFASGRFLEGADVRPAAFLNYAIADYYIQDAGSLLPLALLDIQPEDIVLDLCAAPGGKASAIAERLGPNGALLANESIRSRLDVLKYSLARTGNPAYAVCSYDPDELARFLPRRFDAILVDAPCSGQTLVGKNKRDENAFADNQIEHCVLRQRRILQAAVQMLKPGGRLIYSTCTFATEENEDQIQWLHRQYPDAWQPIVLQSLEPWGSPLEPGCYRLWPHRDRCSGGFAAGLTLVKELDEGASQTPVVKTDRPTKSRSPAHARSSKHGSEQAKQSRAMEVLSQLGSCNCLETVWQGTSLCGMTPGMQTIVDHSPSLSIQLPAMLIETGSHFIPTQALGMFDERIFRAAHSQELTHSQASTYMSGNALPVASNAVHAVQPKIDWALATWQQRALGWMKGAGNRWNNHLPAWARLSILPMAPE